MVAFYQSFTLHLLHVYAKILFARQLNIESDENWVAPSFLLDKDIYGVRY